jgi:ligand-binding sensor domain-containing protein/signal transduction histidine kinase
MLFSCNLREEKTTTRTFGPKVVEARGYVLPADSLAVPKVIPINESKLKKVPVWKSKVVPANTNVHLAGTPKVVKVGTPRICTPGQDTFLLPKTVPAIDSPFVAGIPKVVLAKDPAVKDRNPQNFSSFGKLQGLKSERIRSIIEDRAGNLWFGADDGVSKYDGQSFTHFTTAEGLSGNFIWSILEDRAGNIWFGTSTGGVSRYDGQSFTHFTNKEGLTSNEVISILEDRAGNLWFGTSDGLSRYDGKSFTHFSNKEGLTSNFVWKILEDRAGNLWFGTTGGVSMYDGKSFTRFTTAEGLSSNDVSSILEDRAGNLWFGTIGGVNRYDGKSFTHFTTTEGLSNNDVSSIVEDWAGNLWFGTWDGGVSRYDGKTFTHYTTAEGLSNNLVFNMLEDRAGNLWITTWGGGANKYDGKTFTHFTTVDGLSNNSVWSILEDRAGNLWFGTSRGISSYDGKTFTSLTTADGLFQDLVWSILEDRAGNIWFGSNGGVSRYDGKSFTYFTSADGLANQTVLTILEDRAGNLWFGTYNGGVSKYDGKSFTHFSTAEGFYQNFVYDILEDRDGNIWFGTNDGLSKYDGKSLTRFTTAEGLSNNVVSSIMEDRSGNIWCGTNHGVNRYDGKSFTHLTTTEGLYDNLVLSILEDQAGNLWFGTRTGISELTSLKLAELTDKVNSNSVTASDIFFTNYTYEDGFLGIGCFRNALCEDQNGTIWIGANDRLTTYHPSKEKETPDTLRPNIQVNAVMLYNEPVAWSLLKQHQDTTFTMGNGVPVKDFRFDGTSKWYGLPENLSLAHNNNTITFGFIGITMSKPQKVKYQYKLEGNDENWSELSLRTEAPYGNLSHGSYTFKVKAMSSAGQWSDEFQYPFTIRPPWWLTWWAYSLYALGMLTLLWQLHKFQQARTLRIERERTQAKELEQAKEIEKAYTQLETAHENLKSTQAQLIQSEKMASLGQVTAGIAHEIQNPLNFVNNFSDVNKELLSELKEEITKGNLDEVKAIANDVIANEEKINHHGKRADAIVKGMLQHSRSSSGVKEPTDINELADEYLRLAYHGLRAKDKSFNAMMKTDFDPSIGLVNVIPQDIGRVILNLITNAFYAVNEKAKSAPFPPVGGKIYDPMVTVKTNLLKPPLGGLGANTVEISVSDNGPGIPQSAIDKIFQPFFTTKPTGQGTG